MKPLADKFRPETLSDVIGQEHLIATGKPLRRIIEANREVNMIFYGPPGVGKTTIANIIASKTNKKLYKLNATNASVKDIKAIVDDMDSLHTMNGILLYLDEIQNFNKKQQQSLLEYIENGKITLIASTTENPYQYVYKAILSRSMVFEFKNLNKSDIEKLVKQIFTKLEVSDTYKQISYDEDVLSYIADMSGGDARRAINIIELASICSKDEIGNVNLSVSILEEYVNKKYLDYDKNGDSHYDILSAFQKSIRGSDPDASIHYLARLIKADDLLSICRRLQVIACEDIGLAYPSAITIVKACTDSAKELGFPEARIPLAEATLLLATAPKSNSAYMALDKAMADLDTKEIGDIPRHLKNTNFIEPRYKYPHAYSNNYVEQQYLPDKIKNAVYYESGGNKLEQMAKEHMNKIKGLL
ncbi:MAG TPA: AAA family ATPase [Clostridiales bacterium]|nr:MAG: hypothetical protein A2Y18_04995 [Clostridiales bacterium GWD2_32_19]HCC06711.1 AAA family ATPase [Clostridiales bacterium]